MLMATVDVSLNAATLHNGTAGFVLKLQDETWEINIFIMPDELALIPSVRNTNWEKRSSLKIGEMCHVPTFWSCEGDILIILAGDDDECWDMAVSMPATVIDEITQQAVNFDTAG